MNSSNNLQEPLTFIDNFSYLKTFLFPFLIFLLIVAACRSESSLIKAAGVVDGETYLLTSLVGGQIVEYNLHEGDKVVKGQVAARIDSAKLNKKLEALLIAEGELRINQAKLEKQIDLLKRNHNYWQKQVERLKKLAESHAVTGDELDRAQLQLDQVEAEIEINRSSLESLRLQQQSILKQREELELQLQDYTLKIPVDGQVLESLVTLGETILPGKALARILVHDSLFVETFLEERELARLKPQQEATIIVDGFPRPLKGQIYYISREAEFSPKYIISEKERKALLYQVKIKVGDKEGILKLGMPVTVIIKPEN